MPGRADLAGFLQPLGVDHGSRATHRRAQGLGQFLGDGDVVFFLNAAADGNQNAVLGDIDIAGFGDDRLQIATSCRQRADLSRLVDDAASDSSAFQRLERARTYGDHRAR